MVVRKLYLNLLDISDCRRGREQFIVGKKPKRQVSKYYEFWLEQRENKVKNEPDVSCSFTFWDQVNYVRVGIFPSPSHEIYNISYTIIVTC